MTELAAHAAPVPTIAEEDRNEVAHGLARLLADTYTIFLKTQNYHWNVTGPSFPSLHLLFEAQYTELAGATDLVAERVRALGERAPATYHELASLSSIADDDDGAVGAEEMVRRLLAAHETVAATALSVLPAAERAHDVATADLLGQRMSAHQKAVWMLRSTLES